MYIISLLAIIISPIIIAFSYHYGLGIASVSFDVLSLVLLLFISIPIFISSRLTKDLKNGFEILFKKGKETSLTEIKRSIEALDMAMKTFLYSGLFIFLFSLIIIMQTLDDPASLAPNISISLLSCIYGLVINIILLPIKARLKIKMIDYIQA